MHLLAKASNNPLERLHYWKSGGELETDSVISDGQRPKVAIQSCVDVTDPDSMRREMNGLLASMEKFHLEAGTIVTAAEERVDTIEGKTIKIFPAWRWILMDLFARDE